MRSESSRRLALVVASQSAAEAELEGLEALADSVTTSLFDPDRGGWAAAEGTGLLINPRSVAEVERAVRAAVERAAGCRASLLLVFLGHGARSAAGDFLFLLPDSGRPATAGTAYPLAAGLREALLSEDAHGLERLFVILDACASGYAAEEAARKLFPLAVPVNRSIELVTSTDGGLAYDLAFSRRLDEILDRGHARLPASLDADALREVLVKAPAQRPQGTRHDSRQEKPKDGDRVARNVAHDRKYSLVAAASVGLSRFAHFRLTKQVAEVAAAAFVRRVVVLEDALGRGKTTLLASLTRRELLKDTEVPLIAAFVSLNGGMYADRVMAGLSLLLRDFLPGFAEAVAEFERAVPTAERQNLASAERHVSGPLRHLTPLVRAADGTAAPVRVIIDGLDQLAGPFRPGVIAEIGRLLETSPEWFGVIMATRSGPVLPQAWHRKTLPPVSGQVLSEYFEDRGVDEEHRTALVEVAAGNWQIANLLAKHGQTGDVDTPGLTQLYDQELGRARSSVPPHCFARVDPLVTVLAAAGADAVLPVPLLLDAGSRLGGPTVPEDLEAVLTELAGLLVRRDDPADGPLIGVDHPSWVEHVRAHGVIGHPGGEAAVMAGHGAIADAIAALAPMERHDPTSPLHRYAATAEPEHLWQAERYPEVIAALEHRASDDPAANRDLWLAWAVRLAEALGRYRPLTLTARRRAAYWAGKAGSYERSRELYEAVLADQLRESAPEDPEVLDSRHRIAYATGRLSQFARAIELHEAVLADQTRVFGPDDRRTLETRHHIAYWTGRGGRRAEGLAQHEAVLRDQLRTLSPLDKDVLESRHYIAYWYGQENRLAEALDMHTRLLEDRTTKFGAGSEQVVYSLMNICLFTGESGRIQEAVAGYRELLPMAVRHKGSDHPDVLLIRLNEARFVWEAGDPEASLRLHLALLGDLLKVHRADEPRVSICRHNIAMVRAETGDTATALAELDALLAERVTRYGAPDHREVLITRHGLADIGARAAGPEELPERVRELRSVLADRERTLGPQHRDTLLTRSVLAGALARGASGPGLAEAERLLRTVIDQQARVRGGQHPQTMASRYTLADLLLRTGRQAEAKAMLNLLLPDQTAVLGADHPQTKQTWLALS
ncbi:tetratricopeptide repeat protein [Kitasatospora sp. NPDC003701]